MSEATILSLQQRRELEQAVVALEKTRNEPELREGARKIVLTYSADAVLKTILKHLVTPSSQLRGGLAHLTTLLPLEMTIATLRHYAANRENPRQGRETAVMILERFLAETVSPGVLGDLHDSSDAAFQSLSEAVEEGKQNRHVLLDYVTQMQEYGEEIAFAVLESLDRLPAVDRVDLLRLLAQNTRQNVAQMALTRLDALAAAGDLPTAVRALATLLPVLDHNLLDNKLDKSIIEPVERTLRKLQMRGKGFRPIGLQDAALQEWRALISPADVSASQSIWLIQPAANITGNTTGTANISGTAGTKTEQVILNLIVNLRFGLSAFHVIEAPTAAYFPTRQPTGKLIRLPGERTPTFFLEASAGYAIWLAQHALRLHKGMDKEGNKDENKSGQTTVALNGEYKLYNELIWQFNIPTPLESVRPYFDASASPTALPSASVASVEVIEVETIEEDVTRLMAQPAMQMWRLPATSDPSQQSPLLQKLSPAQFASALLTELAGLPEAKELIDSMAWGLRAQAAWFSLANDPISAAAAHRLSQVIPTLPLVQNLLLRRMIETGRG